MNHRHQQQGFTLIEICVALLIFSIIAVTLSVGLQQIMRNKQHLTARQQQLTQLQLALFMLERDLTQAVKRTGFAPLNKTAAFIGSATRLQFVRTGYVNPLFQAVRSELQIVTYEIAHDQLLRSTRMYNSTIDDSLSRVLLEPVHETQEYPFFQYLDADNQWQTLWPPPNKPDTGLPKAVQLAIAIPERGGLTQWYVLANASGAAS